MARPTFTASEIARYVYCNLAWSYDVLGTPVLSDKEAKKEKQKLESKKELTPEEQKHLMYLKSLEQSYTRRSQGDSYHSRVYQRAVTIGDKRQRVFVITFVLALIILLIIWLFSK